MTPYAYPTPALAHIRRRPSLGAATSPSRAALYPRANGAGDFPG